MKLLWLPCWYPNKTEPYAGDFIQRHARAVALYNRVQVIHLVRDIKGTITKSILEEVNEKDNLAELIIYYYTPVLTLSFFDKLLSGLRYGRLYRRAVKRYIQQEGRPDCVHVHVAGKNVLPALWMKRNYKTPFVVSEHWTAYLPEAVPGFQSFSVPFKSMWRKAIKAAAGITVVSRCLGEAMTAIDKDIRFTVIPNVVDETVFFPAGKKEAGPVHFIHISSLGYQKNPEAIIKAFALVKQTMPGFRLSVFGPHQPGLQRLVAELGLQEEIRFYEEVPQPVLARWLQQADALILYSRYETFGCVLIEANACGVPAIVSDIPVHHETIEEGFNGYFAEGENAAALADKLSWFMRHSKGEHKEAIAARALEKYNYKKIGNLFTGFYENITGPGV